MSQNYYKLYISNTINLAATLCIKSQQSADFINTLITNTYGANAVNTADPTTWKYYLNICGQYHPTDTQLYITSLDTLQLIPFTIESLAANPATASAYVYGSRYYNELVNQNPLMEQLILGVLYPANMTQAINAPDNTILSYPSVYVESNEETLISRLQTWIYNFRGRWDNPQFGMSDNLYCAASHAILYLNLVPALITLRLRACGTREVHSFHVQQYLASHNGLDEYLASMTLEQSLYFYRNIAYLERNPGSQSTFNLLMQNIMTVRNLPLAQFLMEHDITTMPASLYPDISFRKLHLNLPNDVNYDETDTLDVLLTKETPLATGNSDYITYNENNVLSLFQNSVSATLGTKVLESSVTSAINEPGEDLDDILFYEWLHLSNNNLYNVYIRTTNPLTGKDIILSTQNAFLYAAYCSAQAVGIAAINVPTLIAIRVQNLVAPTLNSLMAYADTNFVDSSTANAIIASHVTIPNITSTQAFYELCQTLQSSTATQAMIVSNQQDYYARGLVDAMVESLYYNKAYAYGTTGQTMDSWLAANSLPAATALTTDQYNAISTDLIAKGTGANLVTTESIVNLQQAMVNLMAQLSSYSIQFLIDSSGTDLNAIKWPMIRLGNINLTSNDTIRANVVNTDIIEATTYSDLAVRYDSQTTVIPDSVDISITLEGDLRIADKSPKHYCLKTLTGTLNVGRVEPSLYVEGDDSTKTFAYYDWFNTLSADDKLCIRDIYCNTFGEELAGKLDVVTTITTTILPAFIYFPLANTVISGFEYLYIPNDSSNEFIGVQENVVLNAFNDNAGSIELLAFNTSGGVDILTTTTPNI